MKNTEPGICHIAHGVLEGPDDGVQHELELLWRDGQEGREAVVIHSLNKKIVVKISAVDPNILSPAEKTGSGSNLHLK